MLIELLEAIKVSSRLPRGNELSLPCVQLNFIFILWDVSFAITGFLCPNVVRQLTFILIDRLIVYNYQISSDLASSLYFLFLEQDLLLLLLYLELDLLLLYQIGKTTVYSISLAQLIQQSLVELLRLIKFFSLKFNNLLQR